MQDLRESLTLKLYLWCLIKHSAGPSIYLKTCARVYNEKLRPAAAARKWLWTLDGAPVRLPLLSHSLSSSFCLSVLSFCPTPTFTNHPPATGGFPLRRINGVRICPHTHWINLESTIGVLIIIVCRYKILRVCASQVVLDGLIRGR